MGIVDTAFYKDKPKEPKTSITHPLKLSWIIPPHLQDYPLPKGFDLYDYIKQNEKHDTSTDIKGNICLSSCPGKKIRLSKPMRGRASINRDLDLDLSRIQSFGITTIVCCLDDYELDFLGVHWPRYERAAAERNIEIFRLPMVEGSCPNVMDNMKKAIDIMNDTIKQGNNVLIHCRGGIGRAGLVACCWLLENLLCQTAEKAISIVREQRSVNAIETLKQAGYVIRYSMAVRQRHGLQSPTMTRPKSRIPDQKLSAPSLNAIAQLEYDIVKV